MDEATPPARKPRFIILRLMVLLLLGAAAYAGYLRYVSPEASTARNQQLYDNIAVLETRLQNIETSIPLHEKRIEELEQKVAGLPPASAATSSPAVAATLEASEQNKQRIAALEKEIAILKAAPMAQVNDELFHSVHLFSVFYRLHDRILSGKPFTIELKAFEELAGDDAESGKFVTAVAPYAASGIPTLPLLIASFDSALETFAANEAAPPANAGVWDRFIFNLRHLVSVRRLDEKQAGNGIDVIITRAQLRLEREEIEGAISEIRSLPEMARSSFIAWLEDAQISVAAQSLLDRVEDHITEKAFHKPSAQPPVKGKP